MGDRIAGEDLSSALLLGRDHTRLGAVAAVSEGPAAIALSRGGAAKTYAHVEPNEDAAAFALGAGGALIAVADGHHGGSGSERVLQHLLEDVAAAWTARAGPHSSPAAWREALRELLLAANHAVLEQAARAAKAPAPTTLGLVLVRPREDLLLHVSVGDSLLFRTDSAGGVRPLTPAAFRARREPWFLGQEAATRAGIDARCPPASESLTGCRALLLATDGLSERGIGVADPLAAAQAAVATGAACGEDLRALAACKALCQAALAAQRAQQAGDNIAAAVLWLAD